MVSAHANADPLVARIYAAKLDNADPDNISQQWMMTAYPKNEYAVFYKLEAERYPGLGQPVPEPITYTATRFIVSFGDLREPSDARSHASDTSFEDEGLDMDVTDEIVNLPYLECPRFREDIAGRWYKVGSVTVDRKSMLSLITTVGKFAPRRDADFTERVVLSPIDSEAQLPDVPFEKDITDEIRSRRR